MRPRTLVSSPLVHFFGVGALIFVLYAVLDDEPAEPPPDAIVLTPEAAADLAEQFRATWNRAPTREELQGLMRAWARDEALEREALSLGLDRGDPMIRQRLVLKMRFLAEAGAGAEAPDEADLQAYLEQNADRFREPARLAFSQILLPPDAGDDGKAILASLDVGADPTSLGKASLLPGTLALTPAPAVDGQFGDGFSAALAALPLNEWAGPVESAYGRHLVMVSEREEASLPALSDVRNRVSAEWRDARARERREAFADAVLERYSVSLPDVSEVPGQ